MPLYLISCVMIGDAKLNNMRVQRYGEFMGGAVYVENRGDRGYRLDRDLIKLR